MPRLGKLLAKLASLVLLAYLATTCAIQYRANLASRAAKCHQHRIRAGQQCRAALKGLIGRRDHKYQFSPPSHTIPAELLSEFTQNGAMPVQRYAYVNEALDKSNPLYATRQRVISPSEVTGWRVRVRNEQALSYNTLAMERTMKEHRTQLQGRSLLVLGSQQPWVEALGLEMGARTVTTVDHADKTFEQSDLLWHQLSSYLDQLLAKLSSNEALPQFSNAVSYSYIEHLGLGRYGEALCPDADLHALRLLGCLLEPGGLLFLGLQTSAGLNQSYIEFNFHRVYGKQRLALLFGNDDWRMLSHEREDHNKHSLFVLQKPPLEDGCASSDIY